MKKHETRYNPALPFIRPDIKGNLRIGKEYQNGEPRYHPSWWTMLRQGLSANPQRREKKADTWRPTLLHDDGLFESTEDMIVWLGHSSFLLRMGGVTLLTDPCYSDLPFYPRQTGLPCAIERFVGIDYILLSHGHRDHLDLPTLKKLQRQNPHAKVLTALGLEKLVQKAGFTQVQTAAWYQQYDTVGAIEIVFLPALHWNRRFLHDYNHQLWGSFFIKQGQNTLYFAGDTAYGQHFRAIADTVGPIDWCLMPIGTYKPDYVMRGAHQNPQEAFQAFHDLRAKRFVPMHYGMYDLSFEPLGEPLALTKQYFEGTGHLVAPAIGERIDSSNF